MEKALKGKELKLVRQLMYDFPDVDFDYIGTDLIVNGKPAAIFLTLEELSPFDPVKQNAKPYYQLFVNIVYNQFGISPVKGSYADRLVIDEKEARKSALAQWFSKRRIAFVEDGESVTAVTFEIEGEPDPLKEISDGKPEDGPQDEDLELLKPITPEEDPEKKLEMSPEEKAKWKEIVQKLKDEGETIKKELREERKESRKEETKNRRRRKRMKKK